MVDISILLKFGFLWFGYPHPCIDKPVRMSTSSSTSLSIGEVVKATGVGQATLRAWERRYGFPLPQREPSGHRRYSAEQVERIRRVARERERGVPLPQAIERGGGEPGTTPSLFARLRERRPELQPTRIHKRLLTLLARAIEDESAARAERTLLIGSFQRERFYRQSEPRWRQLARGTENAFVLAGFERVRRPRGGPVEVPIAPSHPLASEWALICLGPGHGACLIAWEAPGQAASSDGERVFEVLLSVEPAVVREAAAAATEIAAAQVPELAAAIGSQLGRLVDAGAETQLRLSAAIMGRLLAAMP
jgi:DICT domain-containing protein